MDDTGPAEELENPWGGGGERGLVNIHMFVFTVQTVKTIDFKRNW